MKDRIFTHTATILLADCEHIEKKRKAYRVLNWDRVKHFWACRKCYRSARAYDHLIVGTVCKQ